MGERFSIETTERAATEHDLAPAQGCELADAVAEHAPDELKQQTEEPLLPLED